MKDNKKLFEDMAASLHLQLYINKKITSEIINLHKIELNIVTSIINKEYSSFVQRPRTPVFETGDEGSNPSRASI